MYQNNSLQGLNGIGAWWRRNKGSILKVCGALVLGGPAAALVVVVTELALDGDAFQRIILNPTGLLPADEAKLNGLLVKLENWLESIKSRIENAINNQNIGEANAILKDLYLIQRYYTAPDTNVLELIQQNAKDELYKMMDETRNMYENIILAGFEKNNTGVATSNSYVIPLLVRELKSTTFNHKVILTSTDPNNTTILTQVANGTAPKDVLFTQIDVVMPGDPKNIPDKLNPATGEPISPGTPDKKQGTPLWFWLLIGVGAYKLLKKK